MHDPHPLTWGGREVRGLLHESGESILPMGQQRSYRAQPALSKNRVCGTLRDTSRLSGRNGPNRCGEIHTLNNGLREFMPGTIAGIRYMTDSTKATRE